MTVDLYVESSGKGAPLVMLHGWGMHGGIWEDCVPSLAAGWRVIRPDLPELKVWPYFWQQGEYVMGATPRVLRPLQRAVIALNRFWIEQLGQGNVSARGER